MAQKAVAAHSDATDSKFTESKIAVRTCIGCRKTSDRLQLVRLVRSSNTSGELEALVDVARRMPGRGAWLHPNLECWNLALKRRAVGRALPGVTKLSDVEAFAQENLPPSAE